MANDTSGDGSEVAQHGRQPQLRSCTDAAAAYQLVQQRIDALVRGRAEVAELPVPACPDWTVRQTVSHLTGVAQDAVSLNLQGVGTESWTQAQVDRLAAHGLDEVLDLWAEKTNSVVQLLEQSPDRARCSQAVFDAITHEHDIRGALGEPGSRTQDPATAVALGFLTTVLDGIIRQAATPSLLLTTAATLTVQLGDPGNAPSEVAVELSDFEALRAFGGRRSTRQLQALPWRGDPTNLLGNLSTPAVRPPGNDLIE
jgi:uncharacterized protein (TIGR03083 family)